MKKIILLLSILISFAAQSQCVIDGTTYIGTARARTMKSCDVVVQSLSDGMVKSHGDSLKTAVAGVDYATPASVLNAFTNWSSGVQYATGNSVIFGNNIYTANTTPTIAVNPGGNSQWTLQVIDPAAYSGVGSWAGIFRAPTMNYVGVVFDAIYDSLANLTPVDTSLFLKKSGGTMTGDLNMGGTNLLDVNEIYCDFFNNSSGFTRYNLGMGILLDNSNINSVNIADRYLLSTTNTIRVDYGAGTLQIDNSTVTIDWVNREALGNWTKDAENTDSLSIATYSQIPITGSKSQALVAATTITVTIGTTMPDNMYKVFPSPTSTLAIGYYITNKTTTTFDFVLPLTTGTVTFDWSVSR